MVAGWGGNFPGEQAILLFVMATAALGRLGGFFRVSSTDRVEGILAQGYTGRGSVSGIGCLFSGSFYAEIFAAETTEGVDA